MLYYSMFPLFLETLYPKFFNVSRWKVLGDFYINFLNLPFLLKGPFMSYGFNLGSLFLSKLSD